MTENVISHPKDPMVDIMALNAVESLYHPGPRDPWAERVAANFIDFFIYSDYIRYPIVRPEHVAVGDEHKLVPRLLTELKRRDSSVFSEIAFVTEKFTELSEDAYDPTLAAFGQYVLSHVNKGKVRGYVESRRARWINRQPKARLVKHYVFDPARLEACSSFHRLVNTLEITKGELCYTLDLVLRYSLYGTMAGTGTYYLSHPLRSDMMLPMLLPSEAPNLIVPLPIGREIVKIAPSLTLDDFTILLHEAREAIRSRKIHLMKRNQVDREVVREVASNLRLPGRLKDADRALVITTGLLSMAAATHSPVVAGLAAGAFTVLSGFWKGPLPRPLTGPWFKYAITYDIEKAIE